MNWIHNPAFRRFLLSNFGKKQFFWKIVSFVLRFLKMQSCIFCKIVNGEISSRKVYEDEKVLAFHDINPQAPIHILVIPKKHIMTIREVNEDDKDLLFSIIKTCNKIADDMGIGEKGFRIVVNTNPYGGQTVYHLHFHLIGGRQMRWPPG